LVLTRQAAAGKWGAATYALSQASDPIRHRIHRGYTSDGAETDPPMGPMGPMPDAIDAEGVPPGGEIAL
jgi:hypothetical protein